jgi:hypothetical protein
VDFSEPISNCNLLAWIDHHQNDARKVFRSPIEEVSTLSCGGGNVNASFRSFVDSVVHEVFCPVTNGESGPF